MLGSWLLGTEMVLLARRRMVLPQQRYRRGSYTTLLPHRGAGPPGAAEMMLYVRGSSHVASDAAGVVAPVAAVERAAHMASNASFSKNMAAVAARGDQSD